MSKKARKKTKGKGEREEAIVVQNIRAQQNSLPLAYAYFLTWDICISLLQTAGLDEVIAPPIALRGIKII
jgi:hypothetical protein